MSALVEARAALASIPGWRSAGADIEVLGGGLSNRTFRVRRGGENFLLRLDAAHTAAYGIDRAREFAAQASAAEAGLAPPLLYADGERGVLLRRFLTGHVWTAADLDDPQRIAALAMLLRHVHALPLCGHALDVGAVAARYLEGLGVDTALARRGAGIAGWLAGIGPADSLRCCHNDVVAGNLIDAPGLMLLDWEYAADNDPLFDLASLVGFHELGDAVALRLLGEYLGEADAEARERLDLQLAIYRALAWLWFANREIRNPEDRQRRRLERLEQALRNLLPG